VCGVCVRVCVCTWARALIEACQFRLQQLFYVAEQKKNKKKYIKRFALFPTQMLLLLSLL